MREWWGAKRSEMSDLVGKTIETIINDDANGAVVFVCATGEKYKFYHSQDCCESVYLAETIGDWDDLIGSPILDAREEQKEVDEENPRPDKYGDACEGWTFYIISTIKGTVTMRWYGASNGYYSIAVDLVKLDRR